MKGGNIPEPPHARIVSELDVESLAPGMVHRLAIELVEDAMGRPIRVPVLAARGHKPGPVFGLTAALHGNELNGIPVIHRLFRDLNPENLRGTLVAVVVANVPGYLRHQRAFNDGQDLNHLFPGVEDGNLSQLWAHRLLHRVVNRFDALIDLHTASAGRINSLYLRADMHHEATARMAYLLRPQIILHNPPSDKTMRGAAAGLGIPAITLEIGNPGRFQEKFIRASRAGIRAVLADQRLLPKRKVKYGEDPILCASSRWLYTDRGGILKVVPDVTDRVKKDELVATQVNAFGDLVREYRVPTRGVIIGRSIDPVGQAGARIVHLGMLAGEEHGFVQRESE